MTEPEGLTQPEELPKKPALKLDVDLIPDQSQDDTDAGWSETAPDPAGDLRRFLDEVPPHHGD